MGPLSGRSQINDPLCVRLVHKGTFMFLQNPRNEMPDHFLAFANPTRLRILERLAKAGEVKVNDLAEHLHMSQPRVSWHLRTLRLGGGISHAAHEPPRVWSPDAATRQRS